MPQDQQGNPRQSLKTPEVGLLYLSLPSGISPRPSKAKVSRSCVQFLTKPQAFSSPDHFLYQRFTSLAQALTNPRTRHETACVSCIESHGSPAAESPRPVCFRKAPPSEGLGSDPGLEFWLWLLRLLVVFLKRIACAPQVCDVRAGLLGSVSACTAWNLRTCADSHKQTKINSDFCIDGTRLTGLNSQAHASTPPCALQNNATPSGKTQAKQAAEGAPWAPMPCDVRARGNLERLGGLAV